MMRMLLKADAVGANAATDADSGDANADAANAADAAHQEVNDLHPHHDLTYLVLFRSSLCTSQSPH